MLKLLATAAFAVGAVVFTNTPATAQGGATVMGAGPGKAGICADPEMLRLPSPPSTRPSVT